MAEKPQRPKDEIKELKKELRLAKKELKLAHAFMLAVLSDPPDDPDRPPMLGVCYKVVEADPIKDSTAYGT